tara:strand:+ start:1801 stop:3186 length:1386 start_codon:yes stop_codon:yes gene_type:complete
MGLLDGQDEQLYYDGKGLGLRGRYGGYQFVSLTDIIDQFMLVYIGEDKIIPKAKKIDVAFHAQRALAELSFDTLKSHKAQEITLPPSLQMILPMDYVNYTRVLFVDNAGIKHPLYPTKHTQNPTSPFQNSDGEFKLIAVATCTDTSSTITLDKVYTDITVGMRIFGEKIPADAFVQKITHNSTSTIISMTDDIDGGAAAFTASGFDGDVEVQFRLNEGSIIQEKTTSFKVEGITWANNSNILTAASASDISEVKVGMTISTSIFGSTAVHAFTIPTVVTDIQGTSIYLSSESSASGTGVDVTFLGENSDSQTFQDYKSNTPSENSNTAANYKDDRYWPADGERYGLDPSQAQVNGSFFIDDSRGLIHFSSNLSGKTIVLDYISDSLGTDGEMIVHKFAEEAMYKSIAYAIASGKITTPEYLVQRLKKERFAAIRTAKLRLSNIKLEELTQILRGKSKWIKH